MKAWESFPYLSIIVVLCVLAMSSAMARDSQQQNLETRLKAQGHGGSPEILKVSIFGDGNPANGIEDSRIDMSSPEWNDKARRPWNQAAGTIHCDGQNRGSATIVDTREFGQLRQGFVIATSAHVLFDLQRQKRFSDCQFHYMAVDHLPGYQLNIDFDQSHIGEFDPASPRNKAGFGEQDWAFLLVPGSMPGVHADGGFRLQAFQTYLQATGSAGRYQFIAHSPETESISISTGCQVVESRKGDLGGGAWPGQLLDDCDSEGGASGGGLVASIGQTHFLVGIRSGAHWNPEVFSKKKFPRGPPDGANWDVYKNTNFSRAIDSNMIEVVGALVKENSVETINGSEL